MRENKLVNAMKQATRDRIGNWIEKNRLYVFLFGGMAFIFGLLMGDTPLSRAIIVISLAIIFLFALPIETMIDDIG